MNGPNYRIAAFPQLIEARCPACGTGLISVSNGILANFSDIHVCLKCDSAYRLELVQVTEDNFADKAGLMSHYWLGLDSLRC